MKRETFLAIGFVVMCFNSLYQYSWNALEPLLRTGFSVSVVQIALGFTLFSVFSSFFQPLGGHFADRDGPRNVGIVASVLASLGFLGTYLSPNILYFYVFWSLGSIGEGILYGIAANLAMKWFSDRMGFATGIVSMGFGLGSVVANPLILHVDNYKIVTLTIGLSELVVVTVLMSLISYPASSKGRPPGQVIFTTKFWLIYVSFVGAVIPLTAISSQLAVLGKNLSPEELTILISIFPLLSGGMRPIMGRIADKVGIVRTTLILNAILLVGSLTLLVGQLIPTTVLVGFAGGSMITLYFNVAGEIFGTRFSTVNSGILYTGKALGGVLGSFVFAYLYTLNVITSEIYLVLGSLVGVLALIPVVPRIRTGQRVMGQHGNQGNMK
ncbi:MULTISPECIES: OFA family MFS transporter [Metallosphaera]|uniref:OFA family MFS transporter n=1 Tax=Metallosphaera TaxID=41980 RepID=UPI001F05F094|nr:OFA family MFS transporter [Metallosphaera sedula]MCH1770276.1 OFA family MFS transporter [Metallosphaera sedula]MCP6727890.1 OFA family MFS transporter [Metallosphaera sedula]